MREQWVSRGVLLLGILLGIFGTINGQFEYDDPPVGHFLEKEEFDKLYPPTDPSTKKEITQEEWEEILKDQTKLFEERNKLSPSSRAAPFCVDGLLPYSKDKSNPTNLEDDPDLANFKDIFHTPLLDEDVLTADQNGKSKQEYVDSVKFMSIYSPDPPTLAFPDNVGIGRLNQWAHIVITAPDELEGLFIQAISGPVGIPFGEFRTDFECMIGNDKTAVNPYPTEIPSTISMVVPCKYAPRASVRHPMVYVYGGSRSRNWEKKTEFHVHFNWEDVKCSEAIRMQFLIVAVKDFASSDFEVFMTVSYEQEIDSGDGIPYPYYMQWNDNNKIGMTCRDDMKSNPKYEFKVHPDRSRHSIIYDAKYDECIRINNKTAVKDLLPKNYSPGDSITCPPGPFLCNPRPGVTPPSNVVDLEKIREQTREETVGNCDVHHCISPAESEPMLAPPKPRSKSEDYGTKGEVITEFLTRGVQTERESKATHGQMMILGWFMLMSVGISVARFYKETGGLNVNGTNGCLGIGKWLWGHILISYAAAAAIWIGIIDVMHIQADRSIPCEKYDSIFFNTTLLKEECETKKNYVSMHVGVGLISVACFHACVLTGWTRPTKTSTRKSFVLSHQALGYAGKILAILSVGVLNGTKAVCKDIILEVFGLELISIILFIAMSFIQKIEDTRLGIAPRKQFPILEAVEVPDQGSPSDGTKTVLHIVTWILHIALYLLVVLTYLRIFGSGVKNPGIGFDGQPGGPFDLLDPFLSFECQVPSARYDIEILRCTGENASMDLFNC